MVSLDTFATFWQAAGLWDAIAIAVLLLSIVLGLTRGLVSEATSLLTWAASLYAAWHFSPLLLDWIGALQWVQGWAPQSRKILAFVLVLVLAMLVIGMVASVVRRALSAVGLGFIDSWLGAAFGGLRGLVVLLLATVVILSTPLQNAVWWQASPSAHWLQQTLKDVAPQLPLSVQQWLPPKITS